MRSILVFCAIIWAVAALPQRTSLEQWNQFKMEHKKVYDTEEETLRFQIFTENLRKIEEHNALYVAGVKSYELGVTKFADMTDGEFSDFLGYTPVPRNDETKVFTKPVAANIPDSIDYRDKKAVNPIKDQNICGGCWAFSITGSLESISFLKTGKLVSLSEQNLIDCSRSYGNYGCDGGIMRKGFDYIKDHGIGSEEKYPFTGWDERCPFNESDVVVKVSGYTIIKAGNEDDLKAAVAIQGPTSVAVDAHDWQLYKGGIYKSDRDIPFLSHGVAVIGYGAEKGVDYWIVRNSWGEKWGESGYIRVARNDKNQAGITNDACYPTVV